MKSSNMKKHKETRLNIRASRQQKEIIAEAAKIRHTTISNFVIEKAYETAQVIVADKVHFNLNAKEWDAFCKALDREPKNNPALKKLFSQPDVFDRSTKKTV